MRELHPLLAGDVHQINIVGARLSRAVLAHPGESQKLSVRRPVGRNRIALIGDALHVGAVGFHGVDLRQAGASADECDLRAGLAIPGWRNVRALIVGQAARVSSRSDPSRKCWGSRCARRRTRSCLSGDQEGERFMPPKARKADHAVEIEGVHHDFPAALADGTEGQPRAVGRDARRQVKCCPDA